MSRLFLILVLAIALAFVSCSKKQDEVDALQQEAAGQDAAAAMDSLQNQAGQPAEESQPATPPAVTQEPEPEPEPDYGSQPGFVVQLGSYNNYELASYWAEKYQNRDYPAFLREVDLNGQTYYRLRIGVYDTYQEAKQVGELLADRYSADFWIDNNR